MTTPVNRIMVYIDGTEQSITAAMYGLALAKFIGSELVALYIINTKALNDLVKARIFLKEEQTEYAEDLQADAERYLKHVKDLAEKKDVPIETISLTGSVHQEIVNMVKQKEIDLLVIGEVSRIRSRRDEFYDEAERAMRAVPCSVLIVKDEERVWDIYNSI
ncbi:MAG: universal stress protein [Spirochaetota bacterium]